MQQETKSYVLPVIWCHFFGLFSVSLFLLFFDIVVDEKRRSTLSNVHKPVL